MQAVSWEDIGLAVDVVQRYLNSRHRADAGVLSSRGQHESEIERRRSGVIAFVDGRIDLEVWPWGEGGGAQRR